MHNEKENVKQGQNILGGCYTGCDLIFAFNTLPMIKGVIYSFTNYKGYGTYDYVGFRNYADLFTDSRVGKSYVFTFKYALAGTILVNVLSLIMAVGLNSAIRFKSALRGIYFVPNILGGLVIGYIFSFIFTYILPTVGNVFHIGFYRTVFLQVKIRVDWCADCWCMAGSCHEYHYLYFRSADRPGGSLRGEYA